MRERSLIKEELKQEQYLQETSRISKTIRINELRIILIIKRKSDKKKCLLKEGQGQVRERMGKELDPGVEI